MLPLMTEQCWNHAPSAILDKTLQCVNCELPSSSDIAASKFEGPSRDSQYVQQANSMKDKEGEMNLVITLGVSMNDSHVKVP